MNFTAQAASALPGPDWLRELRAKAAVQLEASEWPTTEQEIWRYSRIGDLSIDDFEVPPTAAEPVGAAPTFEMLEGQVATVVTWNGRIVSVDIPEDVATLGVSIAGPDETSVEFAEAADAFGYLNAAFALDPIVIDIPRGAVVETPIVVQHWMSADRGLVCPRVIVRCGEAAQATVCEYFASDDEVKALVVPVTELEVGSAGNLSYVAVQVLGSRTWQIGHQLSRVDRDATLRSTTVALGGDYARVKTESSLIGTGATSELDAVYFGAAGQMHDFRTLQHHEAPKTTSNLLFKGAVGDGSRSVYSGMIRVLKGAAGTNAFQTNRNLVLSANSGAESVPNLEIEENDVRCSHASAVGPIDEEQQYYLESRGVPTHTAQRLIVLGFLDEILAKLPIAGLHKALRVQVAAKLDGLQEGIR